ncbi:MAG: amidohydrolase family protein [Myxococcales bacterium]
MLPRLAGCLLACLLLVDCQGCATTAKAPNPTTSLAIPKFDVHSHLGPFDVPDAMRLYATQGIVGVLNLSGGQGEMLDAELEAARPYQGRVLVSVNLSGRHMFQPGWLEHQLAVLRDAKAKGARGLKFYKALGLGWGDPEGQRVQVDDPRLDPIFEEAGRLGLVVSIHTGDPKAFFKPLTPENERWDELHANPNWSFSDPGYPRWEELFAEYERRVARHPKTTFIGVHFGNDPEDPATVAAMLDKYPNLYVDTAARVPEIGRQPPEKLREIFLKHRTRILFGTDFSLTRGEMMLGAPDGTTKTAADFDLFFKAHWRFFETDDRKNRSPHPYPGPLDGGRHRPSARRAGGHLPPQRRATLRAGAAVASSPVERPSRRTSPKLTPSDRASSGSSRSSPPTKARPDNLCGKSSSTGRGTSTLHMTSRTAPPTWAVPTTTTSSSRATRSAAATPRSTSGPTT